MREGDPTLAVDRTKPHTGHFSAPGGMAALQRGHGVVFVVTGSPHREQRRALAETEAPQVGQERGTSFFAARASKIRTASAPCKPSIWASSCFVAARSAPRLLYPASKSATAFGTVIPGIRVKSRRASDMWSGVTPIVTEWPSTSFHSTTYSDSTVPSANVNLRDRVSRAMNSFWLPSIVAKSLLVFTTVSMKSSTSRSISFRICWIRRMISRAYASPCNSGVMRRSR